MLNRQIDGPDASQADLAVITPQLKQLQWDSPGEEPALSC